VDIVDIDIPFGSLMIFFLKCSLASIPVTLVLWVALLILFKVADAFGH